MSSIQNAAANEARNRIAMEQYLVAQHKLRLCSVHEVLYGGFWPDVDLKIKAKKDFKKGKGGPLSIFSDLDEDALLNLMKSVVEFHSTARCPQCDGVTDRK